MRKIPPLTFALNTAEFFSGG